MVLLSNILFVIFAIGTLVVVPFALWQVYKLRQEVRAHEANWIEIEKLTDHNKDGDIIIHAHKIPDNKTLEDRLLEDEVELNKLIEQRDKLDEEITARAQLLRLSR